MKTLMIPIFAALLLTSVLSSVALACDCAPCHCETNECACAQCK